MSEGFLAFKGLAWGVAALLVGAVLMPSASNLQLDALRTTLRTSTTVDGMWSGKFWKKRLAMTTPTTTTTPTPTPTTTTSPYPELSMIPSNFDINSEMISARIPGLNTGDDVGAFRFICGAGQVLADDPIVYPGQPGRSHLHQFYGNTAANAYSTYQSLRTTGQSTCMSPLNRSAYWMPAMFDGKGNVVRPDFVQIYYKRWPTSSPKCTTQATACVPLPNGLRFIMGRNMLNLTQAPTGNFHFSCFTPLGADVPNGTGPNRTGYPDMAQALAVCPAGDALFATVDAPSCWDGVHLDSADHRSHVAYPSWTSIGLTCPAAQPYRIPGFTMTAVYTVAAVDNTRLWTLSSDAMAPGEPRGSTFHADWFGAWDNTIMSMWMDNCIDKQLSCQGGELGNGKMMKMFSGFSWTANPRLVPIPG
jgi:hypothetical protein